MLFLISGCIILFAVGACIIIETVLDIKYEIQKHRQERDDRGA